MRGPARRSWSVLVWVRRRRNIRFAGGEQGRCAAPKWGSASRQTPKAAQIRFYYSIFPRLGQSPGRFSQKIQICAGRALLRELFSTVSLYKEQNFLHVEKKFSRKAKTLLENVAPCAILLIYSSAPCLDSKMRGGLPFKSAKSMPSQRDGLLPEVIHASGTRPNLLTMLFFTGHISFLL